MTIRADVVVIGGGIVGAACAYYLCASGLEVHLVERRFPASGTSRACDGLILLWDKTPGAELALGRASAALWTELTEALDADFEYACNGTILLAEGAESLAAARATAEEMEAAGVRAEFLDRSGLHSLEPNLAPNLAGGVFFPDDAQVDARRATLALLSAAQQEGLTLHSNAEVIAIRRTTGGNRRVSGVVTRAGEIVTSTIICAAGVWSKDVARLVGIELPIRPRKGHILVTAQVPGLIRHPLLEGGYASTVQSAAEDLPWPTWRSQGGQVALVAEMTASGTLLLGSSRQFAGFDRSVSLAVLQAIATRAVRFLPSLAKVGVIRSYAGLRPWSPDHLPLIGPLAAIPGFYLATGHEGAGIGLAPITGRLIADWIVGADLPPVAAQVCPDRFDYQLSEGSGQN
ncbi:MAG: FAD-dependent oxidoreductase [Anaerolineae bacterium]|jgi:glycine/D-amino acid oxidase-like deaminating enzyme